ncbi:MAG TPA: hypothetical protein VNT33_04250 [Telluria sp.]|nr:hypothetical protein [Telluria sp.]
MKTLDTHRDLVRAWLLAQGGLALPQQANPQPAQPQPPARLPH